MKPVQLVSNDPLAAELARVCAPVHKRSLGIAVAVVAGTAIFLLTVFHLIVQPTNALNIELLSQYFHGYSVSWPGAFIGAFWGMVGGFVAGWFVAFVRNFMVAARLWFISVGHELANTRDFLDHI